MAGGRPFSPRRFWALARYAQETVLADYAVLLDPEQVFAVLFDLDFSAYARLGASLTGAQWVKAPDGFTTSLTFPG